MKIYKHLFFDLDHTLWDYDRNVSESLSELYALYGLEEMGVASFEAFFSAFEQVNYALWDQYNIGAINKEDLRGVRFSRIFEFAGLNPEMVPVTMEEDFLVRTSSKSHIFPDAKEVLEYLQKKYRLHIITNGFNESQALKIRSAGLEPYFELIVTSETTGFRKPDRRIFDHAVQHLKATSEQCLMIGDNPASDLLGASRAGIDSIYFNPYNRTCEQPYIHAIRGLRELEQLL